MRGMCFPCYMRARTAGHGAWGEQSTRYYYCWGDWVVGLRLGRGLLDGLVEHSSDSAHANNTQQVDQGDDSWWGECRYRLKWVVSAMHQRLRQSPVIHLSDQSAEVSWTPSISAIDCDIVNTGTSGETRPAPSSRVTTIHGEA